MPRKEGTVFSRDMPKKEGTVFSLLLICEEKECGGPQACRSRFSPGGGVKVGVNATSLSTHQIFISIPLNMTYGTCDHSVC